MLILMENNCDEIFNKKKIQAYYVIEKEKCMELITLEKSVVYIELNNLRNERERLVEL